MANILDRMQDAEFLGAEFLTWLYWRIAGYEAGTEEQRGDVVADLVELSAKSAAYRPEGCEAVSVAFVRSIVLQDLGGSEKVTVQASDLSSSSEVRHALAQGKVVTQARIEVSWKVPGGSDRDFAFTVKGSTLGLSSVELPALITANEDDPSGRMSEEIALMAEADALLLALFLAWLELRQSYDWDDVREQVGAWIRGSDAAGLVRRLKEQLGPSGSISVQVSK